MAKARVVQHAEILYNLNMLVRRTRVFQVLGESVRSGGGGGKMVVMITEQANLDDHFMINVFFHAYDHIMMTERTRCIGGFDYFMVAYLIDS